MASEDVSQFWNGDSSQNSKQRTSHIKKTFYFFLADPSFIVHSSFEIVLFLVWSSCLLAEYSEEVNIVKDLGFGV